MKKWLLFISIIGSLGLSDCKSTEKSVSEEEAIEAPTHDAPDQARIDSIKAAKTKEKLKKDGGSPE